MGTRWRRDPCERSWSGGIIANVLSTACVFILALPEPGSARPIPFASDALWTVVRTCQSAMASVGLTFPCLEIRGSADGYSVALLRPPLPRKHLLVVPLTRIVGIESPELRGRAGGAHLSLAWGTRQGSGRAGPYSLGQCGDGDQLGQEQ